MVHLLDKAGEFGGDGVQLVNWGVFARSVVADLFGNRHKNRVVGKLTAFFL